jgi:hypothetical protein
MTERLLFSGALISVSEFACPPEDDAWHDVNVIRSTTPLVVFPRLSVVIRHVGSEPVLATPNLAMLYNPGQSYERELRDARGDECLFIQLHAPAIDALVDGPGLLSDGRMLASHAPAHGVAYFRQHLLGRYLHCGVPDALLVEETAIRLVESVVGARPSPSPRRSSTRASHHAFPTRVRRRAFHGARRRAGRAAARRLKRARSRKPGRVVRRSVSRR